MSTDDRLLQVQELVARSQGALVAAAQRIQEYAERTLQRVDAEDGAGHIAATYQAEATELLALRRSLLDLLELSLPEEIRDRLRGAFTGVGINEAEDRRALAEMVAERPILSLADLTTAEAERLFVEIRKQEEPF
jgi:hypothetical protein